MGRIRVGISGWTYAGWRGDFYPAGLVQKRELEYAAERLTSIEINGSFYSLQRPSSYASWRAQTPEDFVFAVKGGRFITHMKRLRDVDAPLANFFASGVLALGPKTGPFLWQLPPTLRFDQELLCGFLDKLPRTALAAAELAARHDGRLEGDRLLTSLPAGDEDRPLRHALEVRHESFFDPAVAAVLDDCDVAMVVADTAGKFPRLDLQSSDFTYVRLHGDVELYASGYSDEALDHWASRCLEWADAGRDVYVYFDNDAKGYAPHDAMALIGRVGR
jgi:uncharacterized protein YecE (DUF72 family)